MSKEEAKKNEDGKKENAKEPKGPPDEISETRKKRKLVLFAGLTGVIATAAAAGGFFIYKTFVQKPPALSAKAEKNEHASADSADHTDSSQDSNENSTQSEESAKDGHSEKTRDEHKEADKGEHKDDKPQGSETQKDGNEKKQDDHAKSESDKSGDSTKDNANKKEKSDIKLFQSDETFGETFALKKMELNLGNPLENRYLRIAVSLEYTGGKDQLEELQKREPQLRDLIISSVSTRTRLDLLTEKGKEKLRREIINKINESFEKPVKTLYFTDFLVE